MSSERNPTREQIQYDLTEVLRFSYDSGKKDERELQNALTDIIGFMLKETRESEKIPYQYRVENQQEFHKNALTVSKALSQVDPVLSNLKKEMYLLEKGTQVVSQPAETNQPQQVMQKPEEKKPFINLSLGKKKKPAPSLPYQSSLKMQNNLEKLIYNWNLFMEYQTFGVDLVGEQDKEGMTEYLTYHRNFFCYGIAPEIMRVFKQGLEISLGKEKIGALQALTAQMKESFQTRNDFQQK